MSLIFELAEAVNLGIGAIAGVSAGSIKDLLHDAAVRHRLRDDLSQVVRTGDGISDAARLLLEACIRDKSFIDLVISPRRGAAISPEVQARLDQVRASEDPVTLSILLKRMIRAGQESVIANMTLKERLILSRLDEIDSDADRQRLALVPQGEARSPLAQPSPRLVLETVPPLSGHETGRPDLLGNIRDILRSRPSQPVGITAGLLGTGGFGKTVLAQMAAHDSMIRESYATILWLTLGQDSMGPALSSRIRDLMVAASLEPVSVTDPLLAGSALLQGLGDGDCLIVLDDVWSYTQLEPFLAHGPNITLMVTTRNEHCLPDDCSLVRVGQMDHLEASAALTSGLADIQHSVKEVGLIRAILDSAGRWPVLLGLLNASIRLGIKAGEPLDKVLGDHLQALAEDGPAALDILSEQGRLRAVRATLSLSFRSLDPAEIERFFELAVFPEDVDLPLELIDLLWREHGGLRPLGSSALRGKLAARSLLIENPVSGALRLHDVIRSFLRHETKVAALAASFCDALDLNRDGAFGITWEALGPKYTYIYDWAVWHCVDADRMDHARGVLRDCQFIVNKLMFAGVASLERDLRLADGIDGELQSLRSLFGRIHQLFGPGLNRFGLINTLLLRTQEEPELRRLTEWLRDQLSDRWCIEATAPLPDQLPKSAVRVLPHPAPVRRIALNDENGWLLTVDSKATGRFWDTDSGQLVRTVFPAEALLAVNGPGNWAATCDGASEIRIWSVFQQEPIATIAGIGHVMAIGSPPDPDVLVTYSSNGHSQWRIAPTPRVVSHLGAHAAFAGMSSDGKWVRVRQDRSFRGGPSPVVSPFAKDHLIKSPSLSPSPSESVDESTWCDIAQEHDRWIISPSGHLALFHALSYSLMRDGVGDFSFPELLMPITCAAFSADDRLVVTGGADGRVQIARQADYFSAQINAHSGRVNDVSFRADGRGFASAGEDGVAILWQVAGLEGTSDSRTMAGGILSLTVNDEQGLLYVLTTTGEEIWSLDTATRLERGSGQLYWHRSSEGLSARASRRPVALWVRPRVKARAHRASLTAGNTLTSSATTRESPRLELMVEPTEVDRGNANTWEVVEAQEGTAMVTGVEIWHAILVKGSILACWAREPTNQERALVGSASIVTRMEPLGDIPSDVKVLAIGSLEGRSILSACSDGLVRILEGRSSSSGTVFCTSNEIASPFDRESVAWITPVGQHTALVASGGAVHWIDLDSGLSVGSVWGQVATLPATAVDPELVCTSSRDGVVEVQRGHGGQTLGQARFADELHAIVGASDNRLVCAGRRGLYFLRLETQPSG